MQEWWDIISTFEKIFWYISLPFTVILVIQLILTFTGLGGEKTPDIPDASDIQDAGLRNVTVHDSTYFQSWMAPAFHVFTMRNIIAFMTFFGWTGLILIHTGSSRTWTVCGAFIAGILAMMILTFVYFLYKRKRSV